jgi:hypothetical protein
MHIIIDWIKYHTYLIEGNLSCAVIFFFCVKYLYITHVTLCVTVLYSGKKSICFI